MKTRRKTQFPRSKMSLAVAALFAAMGSNPAAALTINVVDRAGAPITGGFRWLVEEDATKASNPGDPAVPGQHLSLSFHTSYMPVLDAGRTATSSANVTLPTPAAPKRYFVSVLPDSGYQMGGAPVAEGGENGAVTVVVNPTPIPTAQISIFVFEDNQPVNGTPDLPQELGLAGFTVTLKEAGGTYGASGGQVTQDAFGNPIGTEYQTNPDGTPVMVNGTPVVSKIGDGFIRTTADGTALIKNLAPAKYTIEIIPPAGTAYKQTSTIEGTRGNDAWVKANEPSFFQEFGPPGHHVFFGFVKMGINDASVLNGQSTITGKVVNMHMSRSPNFAFYNGEPFPQCLIGLNELAVAGGRTIFTAPCNPDSTFSVPNVPAGTYQLVIWDENLDVIIASTNVTVPAGGGNVDLQEVPVFNWFGKVKSKVFFDANNNGFPDAGETGLPDQLVNLRFRDGSIYQSQATDPSGEATFSEVFPFFNWLVAEVDFARFKATGATIVVDAGGPVRPDGGWADPTFDVLNPQPQSENGGAPYRTETGPVLLQGIQTFLGQTNVIQWGKNTYAPGENGGISGIVHYAITRAEDDPRYAVAENWEPGIPRVQVNLYKANADGTVADANGNGTVELADADHMPQGNFPGPEDLDRNGNGTLDQGDAIDVAYTDSWDDSLPTGCQGDNSMQGLAADSCYDGLRNFNQVRPAVFDGGYAFGGSAGKPELPPGKYVVESLAPKGYQTVKEEDKNVDFGDAYQPQPLVLPPVCVGDPHTVPAELALFPGVAAPFAGQTRPLCDRKVIDVAQGKNAAVDFFMLTEVPAASHIVGMILNDLANEFDPNAPTFGEKQAPSWVPVSIRDWTGKEISRVYADQWGTFNALVPSSYSVNAPMPSGLAPNMLTTCMNDPGPIPDPNGTGQMVIDPNFDRQYSQFCYTFQYLPGKTTYLDTPVIPVAAFAGPGQYPLDCEFTDGTPVVYTVNGRATSNTGGGYVSQNGPYVPQRTVDQTQLPTLTIVSAGSMQVPNPAWDGTANTPRYVTRDFGFGPNGTVTLGGVNLPVNSWSNGLVEVSVPFGTPTGELVVTRGDTGKASLLGVTVTVGGATPIQVKPGQSIQAAIDQAPTGALILVAPGRYDELVIMNKKVRLQGWGALATNINAAKVPAEKLQAWRTKVNQLYAAGTFDLAPGQTVGFNGPNNEPNLFNTEEGPGVLVVAKNATSGAGAFTSTNNARIDGIGISGGDSGGGIMVNAFAKYLEISNNKIFSNAGTYGGGIRVGHPTIEDNGADNDFVKIHNNHIALNGGQGGAGGGVSIYAGTQVYKVNNNYICGNFSAGHGGGIGHLGSSNRGEITNNTVIFNQSFNQGVNVSGGGIFVGGQAPIVAGTLSPGAGSVTVSGNLVQGNLAGAGDGGGIAAQFVNGQDIARAPNSESTWHKLTLANNMVVNNVAGMAGGGASLQDVVVSTIANNTIADNDSTATAGAAFAPGSPNQSTAQPAGIVSRAHSTQLYNAIGSGTRVRPFKTEYANPTLVNNILWHNKSSYWAIDNTTVPPSFGLYPNPNGAYWDLAVQGTSNPADKLNPTFSVLTDATGYAAGNLAADPLFAAESAIGPKGQTIQQAELTTGISTAAAFDEGGNWIDVRFGIGTQGSPNLLSPAGNFHLQPGSPAIDQGTQITDVTPTTDIDGQGRTAPLDIGADEQQ